MGKKLSQMTSADFKAELSIAGNPDKIMEMMQGILSVMAKVDATNAAELINLEFLMRRMHAESRTWIRIYEGRTGQKIL